MEYLSWKLYDRVVTPSGMLVLHILLVSAFTAASAGFWTEVSVKIATALYVFYGGILRSFGHFNHDEMVATWCLFIFALSPCGDGFAVGAMRVPIRPASPLYGYPIFLMRCVLAWSYFSAGLLKLKLGGLEYFQPDSFLTLAVNNSLGNFHDTQFRLVFELINYRWLATLGVVAAVIFELSFPLAVFLPRLRWWILSVGVLFHAGTMLLMNITFPTQLLMYVVFVDWESVFKARASTLPISAK